MTTHQYFTSNIPNLIYPSQSDIDTLFTQITQERQEQKSGYYNLAFESKAIQDSKAFLESHHTYLQDIQNIVIIGVGGSSLGLKAIDSMLCHLPNRNDKKLYFLEHTDPIETHKILAHLTLAQTHFIAISKSGTTIETSSLLKYIIAQYNLLDSANSKHLSCITDFDSPLYKLAKSHNISVVCIDKNVGGRFSVLSSVGILPALLLGYDIEHLLMGARELAERFFERKEEHILHKAFFLASNFRILPINVLFSYSSVFRDFNLWYIQLWAESLGKLTPDNHRVGLTPIALLGSIDQHSSLQLIVQGVKNKSVTFLSINDSLYENPKIPALSLPFLQSTDFVNNTSFLRLLNLQKTATLQTLQSEQIPLDSIELDELSEKSVGALIMYFELLTSCAGAVLGINTYDQPGVEFGKKRLKEMF